MISTSTVVEGTEDRRWSVQLGEGTRFDWRSTPLKSLEFHPGIQARSNLVYVAPAQVRQSRVVPALISGEVLGRLPSIPDAGISSALDYTTRREPMLRPLTDDLVRKPSRVSKRQGNASDALALYSTR